MTDEQSSEEDNAELPFNINQYVKVKIKPEGWAIIEARRDVIYARFPTMERPNLRKYFQTDAEGWSKIPLWSLMQEFGAHMIMGLEVPFETGILLCPRS